MINPSPYPQPLVAPHAAPMAPPQGGSVGVPAKMPGVSLNTQQHPKEADLPRYVNYLADYSGCGHWRILWPEAAINARGDGMSQSTTAMVADPRWYTGVKAVKLQRQASSSQLEFVKYLKKVQQEHDFKLIYEVDDVVFKEVIPDYNKFKFAFDTEEIRQNLLISSIWLMK